MRLFYINIDLPISRLIIKVGIYYYKAYWVYLKIIDLWGNRREIKNIFYEIEGIDKPLIFRMPSLTKKDIFINIIILL